MSESSKPENYGGLKEKTVSGVFWSFGERILAQVVSLVVSIILARLLTPDDYSIVGIVAIFFAFANVFISGGFNAALMQKKDADVEDYSSVLYISLGAAIVFYLVLFFCAPLLADLYEKEILVSVFRIMGLTLFINAVKSVICAYISSHLLFRKFFWSTIIGTVISAIVGIIMAYQGFGPWALVAQQMTNSIIDVIVLFATARIRFVFRFSKEKAKGLFKYGWKILAASGVSVLYDELNPLIVGVKYSGTDLSFYTKGRSFPGLINSTVGSTLSAVLFPSMAKMQDDKDVLLRYTRRFMQVSTFLIFPMMIGFLIVSENFILLLLTEKWLPATIYMQAFCVVYMFDMIQVGNLQVIRALGRSDVTLILEIIKKVAYAIVILLFVLFTNDPVLLAVACVVNTFIATIVNTFPNRRLIGYYYKLQIIDILPNLLRALFMGACVYCIGLLPLSPLFLLVLQVTGGIAIYFLLAAITRNPNFMYILNSLKQLLGRKKAGVNVGEGDTSDS